MNSSKINDLFLSGIGFDVHALEPLDHDHHLMICGIKVPARYRVIAHSDGDVGLHALVDALLGTIGAGDIGEHFPPTDPQWKNANSADFVAHALQLCQLHQATLVNVDITLIAEKPKILAHKPAMKARLVALLGLPAERINIKATTTEKLGFLGRGEGIAAQAIVSVKIPHTNT